MKLRVMIVRFIFVLALPALSFGTGGAPTFVQEHFRWRNDDGGETNATWKVSQDTAITGVTRTANIRLRFALANTSATASGTTAPAVEFSTSTTGIWTQVSVVTNGLAAFEMTASANFANGAATTALLPGSGTFVAGKMVEYPTNAAAGVSCASNRYSNFEFCFHPVAQARGNTTYYFRMRDSSGSYNYSYSRFAQLTMAAGEADEAPVIGSALTATGGELQPFSYQIRASGSEPITYSATSLPQGLALMSGNTITGMPVQAGTYSIGLMATNAWGSNSKTLSLVVAANHAPVAANSTATGPSGEQVYCPLSSTDQDANQARTCSIVSQPAHGTAYMGAGQMSYYRSVSGYIGTDSFTWKCNDGKDDSNIATVTVTVTASVPAPSDQSVVVPVNTPKEFSASYAGGGGYTCSAIKVTSPSHGTVVVTNGTSFRYVPATNYTGMDSFTWRMSYNGTGTTDTVTCNLAVKSDLSGNWPQWRCDEYRSASTLMELPSQLYLQWRRDLRPTRNAGWWANYGMERVLWSVVQGKTMFVALGTGDGVMALDTDTGAQKWQIYANGPVRGAPAVGKINGTQEVVCFGSDDGSVYCVDAATGMLVWKKALGPSNRKVFGNSRMISPWLTRAAGPLIKDGNVYVFSGFWASEGVFAYALNLASGAEVWKNDSVSWSKTDEMTQTSQYSSAFHPFKYIHHQRGGPSPQGWLRVSNDGLNLELACGWEGRAYFSRTTGVVIRHEVHATEEYFDRPLNDGQIVSPTPPPTVACGSRLYTQADVLTMGVSGTVGDMLAADNKLFAVTTDGNIYCFGGSFSADPAEYPVSTTLLPGTSDGWTTAIQQILATTGADAGGLAVVPGAGARRVTEELLNQSALLHVVTVEADTNKVAGLRSELHEAGLYGTRAAVLNDSPTNFGLPASSARLIVVEDLAAAGLPGTQAAGIEFVTRTFNWLRPFGGTAWLPTSDSQHTMLAGWVALAGLESAELTRTSGFSVLKKVGAPSAASFHGPLGAQWWGGEPRHYFNLSQCLPLVDDQLGSADLYTGLPMSSPVASTNDGITDFQMTRTFADMTSNPMTGVQENKFAFLPSANCNMSWADKNNWAARSTGEFFWYDPVTVSGGVYWPAANNGCYAVPGPYHQSAAGNGVLYSGFGQYGGGHLGLGLMPAADVENWASWGYGPSRAVVDDAPVKRIGLNFGAPGDRHVQDGTLWLEYPAREAGMESASPNLGVKVTGAVAPHYHHSSRIKTAGEKWVHASNVTGASNITISLSQPVVALPSAAAVVDGVLNDGCWNGQRPVLLADSGMNPAQAWLRYDADNLYVAMQNSSAGDFSVYLGNRNELERYVRFTVSAAGVATQFLGETGWVAAWNAGTKTGSVYTAEIAIPWSTLGSAGLWKENLVINLYGPGFKRLRDLTTTAWFIPALPGGAACKQFSPLYLGAPRGDLAASITGTVRLHFAETEGATAGQRIFDVKVQGQTVLTNYDIYSDAGAADCGIVKEFPLTTTSNLVVDLVAKVGSTLISGVEFVGAAPARVNQAPVPVIDVSSYGSAAPQTVVLSAARSYDPDGQIADFKWITAEGEAAISDRLVITNLFNDSSVVQLIVTDNDGATTIATATISLTGGTPADFTCQIRAAGGDYTNLTTWQAAIASDLNTSSSRLFRVTDRGTYVSGDDKRAVTFTGGGTGVLRHVNADNIAYITGCSGVIGAGQVACASGNTMTVGNGGSQIRHAVAECYNDWPSGLRDAVTITGWTSTSNHYVRVVAPEGQRHKGKLFNSDGVTYSGFTLVNATYSGYSLNMSQTYTRAEGIAIHALTGAVRRVGGVNMVNGTWFDKGLVCNAGYDPYHDGIASIKCGSENYIMNTIVMNDRGGNGGIDSSYGAARILNVTVVNGLGAGIRGGRTSTVMRNVISSGNAGGDYIYNNPATEGWPDMSQCASSDGTSTGTASRVNQSFKFVSVASNDFHLASDDAGARGFGITLSTNNPPVITDIDGDERAASSCDLGADQNNSQQVMTAPSITSQPANRTVTAGQTALFSVTAAGTAPLAYQWRKNAVNIPGATGASYTTPVTVIGDNGGLYSVVVSNAAGVVASSNAVLTVNTVTVDAYGIPDAWKILYFGSAAAAGSGAMDDPDNDGMCNLAEYVAGTCPTNSSSVLTIQASGNPDGTFGLSFLTATGRIYTGRYCDDLQAGNWGTLAPGNVPGTGGEVTITDTNRPAIRFYRVGVAIP